MQYLDQRFFCAWGHVWEEKEMKILNIKILKIMEMIEIIDYAAARKVQKLSNKHLFLINFCFEELSG